MTTLAPLPGFDWNRVAWRHPESTPSALCSYCAAVIPDRSVALILWDKQSFTARFCAVCQTTFWGMESFDDDDEGEW